MIDLTNQVERILNEIAKSFSLCWMKTAYKAMDESRRLEARNIAAIRITQLRKGDFEDLKVAELWIEFYNWTTTYKD